MTEKKEAAMAEAAGWRGVIKRIVVLTAACAVGGAAGGAIASILNGQSDMWLHKALLGAFGGAFCCLLACIVANRTDIMFVAGVVGMLGFINAGIIRGLLIGGTIAVALGLVARLLPRKATDERKPVSHHNEEGRPDFTNPQGID
jgi:hypothetical protein